MPVVPIEATRVGAADCCAVSAEPEKIAKRKRPVADKTFRDDLVSRLCRLLLFFGVNCDNRFINYERPRGNR